jgi:hypothetical protein
VKIGERRGPSCKEVLRPVDSIHAARAIGGVAVATQQLLDLLAVSGCFACQAQVVLLYFLLQDVLEERNASLLLTEESSCTFLLLVCLRLASHTDLLAGLYEANLLPLH